MKVGGENFTTEQLTKERNRCIRRRTSLLQRTAPTADEVREIAVLNIRIADLNRAYASLDGNERARVPCYFRLQDITTLREIAEDRGEKLQFTIVRIIESYLTLYRKEGKRR